MFQDDLCLVLLPQAKHHDHYQLLGGALELEGVEEFLSSVKRRTSLGTFLLSSGLKAKLSKRFPAQQDFTNVQA